MRYCGKCKVSVTGDFKKCPLCQANLSDDGAPIREAFPVVETIYHRHSLFFRGLVFLFVTIGIAAVAVNLMLPETGFWSVLVVAVVACVWLSLVMAIRRRYNILKGLTDQAVVIGVLSLGWDFFTGWRGWSIDYVIPLVFVCTMLIVSILARVMRLPTESYVIYVILLICFGIIPAIFVAAGWCRVTYPSYLCVTLSLISMAALLVFEGGKMREELCRRLHL